MIRVAHFRRTLAYDAWANDAVLDGLVGAGAPPAACVRWLAHIHAARDLWLARLEQTGARVAVWPELDLDRIAAYRTAVNERWARWLATLTPGILEREIAYTNTRGDSFESRTTDILTHLTHHGTYHRGQIASAMRAAGLEPVTTDFIHAARQGFLPT